MECPHCGEDTDPTLLFCRICGQGLEIDEEAVQKDIERDEAQQAVEFMEERTKAGMYIALFVLAAVIAFRVVVLRRVVADVHPGYMAPAKMLDDKGIDPPQTLDMPIQPVEIPDWRPDKK
jgi:hypothetical protein